MSVVTPTNKECVICYESLSSTKNMCITECGHEFCFGCMMKHVQRNNGCPCCRATLIEDIADSESDAEEGEEDEYEEESGSEAEEDAEEEEYPIENLEAAFVAKGYGLKDALSLLMGIFSKTDAKYTKAYIKQLEDDIEDLNEELQDEYAERVDMDKEDTLNTGTVSVMDSPHQIEH